MVGTPPHFDLIAEFEAAAFAVDYEGQAVAEGDVELEATLLAALERLDVVTRKLRGTLAPAL